MTITIPNADNALIKIIKDLNAFKKETPYKIKKQKANKAKALRDEIEQIKRDIRLGKIKPYNDVDKMFEDIMNG
ncbi:MAG: hypothetical protein CR967_00090 [Proteobacteria bacterium]|nr:MAG: hypothetical protein CR967_00090 [Pseudomonadota bacterium]